jgi:hypothetical protein
MAKAKAAEATSRGHAKAGAAASARPGGAAAAVKMSGGAKAVAKKGKPVLDNTSAKKEKFLRIAGAGVQEDGTAAVVRAAASYSTAV